MSSQSSSFNITRKKYKKNLSDISCISTFYFRMSNLIGKLWSSEFCFTTSSPMHHYDASISHSNYSIETLLAWRKWLHLVFHMLSFNSNSCFVFFPEALLFQWIPKLGTVSIDATEQAFFQCNTFKLSHWSQNNNLANGTCKALLQKPFCLTIKKLN